MEDVIAIRKRLSGLQNFEGYRQENWHCMFAECLDKAGADPHVRHSRYRSLNETIPPYRVTLTELTKDGLLRNAFLPGADESAPNPRSELPWPAASCHVFATGLAFSCPPRGMTAAGRSP